MNYTQYWLDVAQEYVRDHSSPDWVCAFAGGSVGRGEADRYSDLDLNIWISDETEPPCSKNVRYQNRIIQLHVHGLPKIGNVMANPWDFRFLAEARAVYDPEGILRRLLTDASEYFRSPQGRERMFVQAGERVSQRKLWLAQCLDNGEWLTAGVAAHAAWTDAAFAYSYFARGSLSTGGVLPIVRELKLYEAYRDIRFADPFVGTDRLLAALRAYRAHLYKTNPDHFALDPIQDELAARKTARYEEQNDVENLLWQLSGEAFWCYLSSVSGKSLEQHVNELPENIRNGLTVLGFKPYTEKQIDVLLKQTNELLERAETHCRANRP